MSNYNIHCRSVFTVLLYLKIKEEKGQVTGVVVVALLARASAVQPDNKSDTGLSICQKLIAVEKVL